VTVKSPAGNRWGAAILALKCALAKIAGTARIGWKDRFGFAGESA